MGADAVSDFVVRRTLRGPDQIFERLQWRGVQDVYAFTVSVVALNPMQCVTPAHEDTSCFFQYFRPQTAHSAFLAGGLGCTSFTPQHIAPSTPR